MQRNGGSWRVDVDARFPPTADGERSAITSCEENFKVEAEPEFPNAAFQFDAMPQIKSGPPVEKLKCVAHRQRNVIIALGMRSGGSGKGHPRKLSVPTRNVPPFDGTVMV